MNDQPLVSIIVLTYNGGKFLKDTLASISAQTYPNIEVVISDDASIDNTVAIARDFQNSFPKTTVLVNETNLSTARNFNSAFSHVKGAFAIALGQDDILPPTHVEKMLAHFTEDNIALVHCNSMLINAEGQELGMAGNDATQAKRSKNPLKYLCYNNFIKSCGLMFRTDALREIGLWDETYRHCSEWHSYIRYARRYRIVYATDSFAYYRLHEHNLSRKMKHHHFTAYERYKMSCRRLAYSYADLSWQECLSVMFKMARVSVRNALRGMTSRFN